MLGLRIHQDVPTRITAEEFFSLVTDLDRYVAIEPNLRSVRWLTSDAIGVGSVAEAVPDVTLTVSAVRRLIRVPAGLVTITGWDPPRSLAGEFTAGDLVVRARVEVAQRNELQVARVRGVITPGNQRTQMLLAPLRPLLELLVKRSINRGVRRIEAGLS
jgi:hypothetical protein